MTKVTEKTTNEKSTQDIANPPARSSFILPVTIALIVVLGLGAGVMVVQNNSKGDLSQEVYMRNMEESQSAIVEEELEESEVVAETETPTPTVTYTATPRPTQTVEPNKASTTVSKSITLEDPVGGNSFKYTFQVSSSDTVKKAADSTSFSVKFDKGGEFYVQQRYEAYNNGYDSFNQVSGKLGAYFRITYPGAPNAYFYVDSLSTHVTCDVMEGTVMPPCGAGVYADPAMNYLGEFSCNASTTVCDSTMAIMDVVKL